MSIGHVDIMIATRKTQSHNNNIGLASQLPKGSLMLTMSHFGQPNPVFAGKTISERSSIY